MQGPRESIAEFAAALNPLSAAAHAPGKSIAAHLSPVDAFPVADASFVLDAAGASITALASFIPH